MKNTNDSQKNYKIPEETKIVRQDEKTKAYVTEQGTNIKFNNQVSIYSNDPRQPHAAVHIKYDKETGEFSAYSHDKDHNPTGKAQGKCYLTTACMRHFANSFRDDCYELTVLRWFRDNFVTSSDIKLYYEIAPIIVENIDKDVNSAKIYDYIYDAVVDACVEAIENGNYLFAYNRYKSSIIALWNYFVSSKEIDALKVLQIKPVDKN